MSGLSRSDAQLMDVDDLLIPSVQIALELAVLDGLLEDRWHCG
jgi:hypothetical protein